MDSAKSNQRKSTGQDDRNNPGNPRQPGPNIPDRSSPEHHADPPLKGVTPDVFFADVMRATASGNLEPPAMPKNIRPLSDITPKKVEPVPIVIVDDELSSNLDIRKLDSANKSEPSKAPVDETTFKVAISDAIQALNVSKSQRMRAGMSDTGATPKPRGSDPKVEKIAKNRAQLKDDFDTMLKSDPSAKMVLGVHFMPDGEEFRPKEHHEALSKYIMQCIEFVKAVKQRGFKLTPTTNMKTSMTSFGEHDYQALMMLRNAPIPDELVEILKMPLHEIMVKPLKWVDELDDKLNDVLERTSDYYVNFLRLISSIYCSRLALLYKIVLYADEIKQISIDSTIRKMVANLVVFDEYLILMFKNVMVMRFDTKIMMRLLFGAYPTTQPICPAVFNQRAHKDKLPVMGETGNEIVKRLCKTAWNISITGSDYNNSQGTGDEHPIEYLTDEFDIVNKRYALRNIPYELNVVRFTPRIFSKLEEAKITVPFRPRLWYTHGQTSSVAVASGKYMCEFVTFGNTTDLDYKDPFLNEIKTCIYQIPSPSVDEPVPPKTSSPAKAPEKPVEPEQVEGAVGGADESATPDESAVPIVDTPKKPEPERDDDDVEDTEEEESPDEDAFADGVVSKSINLGWLRQRQTEQRARELKDMIADNKSEYVQVKGEEGAAREIRLVGFVEPDTYDDDMDMATWEAKYGAHSVYPKHTIRPEMSMVQNTAVCTIISTLTPIVRAHRANAEWVQRPLNTLWRIGTRLNLPHEREGPQTVFMANDFKVIVPKTDVILPFKVAADAATTQQRYDNVPEAVRLDSGAIDARRMLSVMQNLLNGIPRATADALCNTVNSYSEQKGMMMIFVIAWMQTIMLEDMEQNNIDMLAQGLQPNDITRARLDTNGNANDFETAREAINIGRVTFRSDELSRKDIECMRLISAGTQGLTTAVRSKFKHVLTSYVFEHHVLWCILENSQENTNIPENVRIRAHDMLGFIIKMAETMGRKHDMVRGFIRASVMAHVSTIRTEIVPGDVQFFLINSAHEIMGTSMPRPIGDNWMWRLAHWHLPIPDTIVYVAEARALSNVRLEEFRPLATTAACLISLGYSNVWHTFNITGTVIAHTYRPDQAANAAMVMMQQLTKSSTEQPIPAVSLMACNWVASVSPCSFTADCLQSENWSHAALTLAVEDPIHTWRHIWAESIPYLLHPQSIFFTCIEWDVKWGLSAPGIEGNFYDETQVEVQGRTSRWSAWYGEPDYQAKATSHHPYIYVPYGALAINAIQQEARAAMRIVRYHTALRTDGGFAPLNQPVDYPLMNLAVEQHLWNIRVGSLVTYDWRTTRVIAPTVVVEDQVAQVRQVIEFAGRRLMIRAGIQPPLFRSFTSVNTDLADAMLAANMKSDPKSKGGDAKDEHAPKEVKIVAAADDNVPVSGRSNQPAVPAAAHVDVPADSAAALVGGAGPQPKV